MDPNTLDKDHYEQSKTKQWSTSMSSIDTGCCQDTNYSQLTPSLIKTSSETRLNDGQKESQPKVKCHHHQNLNLTKVLAKIDNTYDRAQAATRQEEVKKKTLLYQRKVSAEIKVAQLDKVLKETAKGEKSHWRSHKPRTPPPSPAGVLETYKELTNELQHIENNLKEATEKQQWTMKEIEAHKTKNTKALHLLVEATEDLLHISDPEDYAQSPDMEHCERSSSFKFKTAVSKTDDAIPWPKRYRTPVWKPSIFRRTRPTHTSSLKDAIHPRMLKNSSFRKLFNSPTGNSSDKEKTTLHEQLTPQLNLPRNGSKEMTPDGSRRPPISRRLPQKKRIATSSATSSSDENEVKTEVSQEALYQILVFEDLINNHMKRARHYEFPFIDDV